MALMQDSLNFSIYARYAGPCGFHADNRPSEAREGPKPNHPPAASPPQAVRLNRQRSNKILLLKDGTASHASFSKEAAVVSPPQLP